MLPGYRGQARPAPSIKLVHYGQHACLGDSMEMLQGGRWVEVRQ